MSLAPPTLIGLSLQRSNINVSKTSRQPENNKKKHRNLNKGKILALNGGSMAFYISVFEISAENQKNKSIGFPYSTAAKQWCSLLYRMWFLLLEE